VQGFQTIIYEKRDATAYVTLNRPQALNAYNIRMRDELFQVLRAIKDDAAVRVAVFKGEGEKAFCTGADLSEFLTAPSPTMARKARWGRDVWGLFLRIPQPLIAAVHGYVLGSGLEIALCCDLRIAAADACFGMPEAGLGIMPAAGGTQTLPRAIGRGRALEMVLANRRMTGVEALRVGLVNQVVPKNQLLPAAEEWARKIASCHPLAVRHAKAAVVRGLDLPLPAGLDLEKRLARKAAIAGGPKRE
jgi:enoyl-CoA hydratase